MSVSCEPIRDRSGRRQAVAPLLTEATRRSINTQASHPGNGSPHGKKRTFFRRAIGWKSFPARRQAGTSSLQTAGNGQNGSDFASRSTGPLSTTESKPPQGSNQRKTKDYGKKAIDRTRKSGYGHADAQHSVCRIHSLHHPFLAHSLKEAPSPAAAFPQRQAAAIFLPSSRHSAYIRFFQAFRQGKRTGPAPPAGTKTKNKKALARDARARCLNKRIVNLVGVPGFEPGTSNSRSWRANRAALHPERVPRSNMASGHFRSNAVQR